MFKIIVYIILFSFLINVAQAILGPKPSPIAVLLLIVAIPAAIVLKKFVTKHKLGDALWKHIKNFVSSPTVSKELKAFAKDLVDNKDYSEANLAKWKMLINSQRFSPEKESKFKGIEFSKLVDRFSDDQKLNDSEWAIVQQARKFYDHDISTMGPVTPNQLGDWRARGIVSEGRLVEMDIAEMPIKAKPDEKLFLVVPALFVKRRKITTRINYDGVTGSIRIGGGFRYRIGSIAPRRVSEEKIIQEDRGVFWITNERCGYHGDKKSWSLPISKLNDMQVEDGFLLEIFKDGRENPILVAIPEIDLTCAVLSLVMNDEYEVADNKGVI